VDERASARDTGEPEDSLAGLCMFYRLLAAQSADEHGLVEGGTSDLSMSAWLPRVTPESRERIVKEIDEAGVQSFTRGYIEQLARDNPELLQMAHGFAANRARYLLIMQGLILIWASLVSQAKADRTSVH